jgi:EAL domain-containing protein (putative c-di-GMP-specific phosphodiesterase class I)
MQRADVAMYLAKERRSGIERYSAAADRNSPDRLVLAGDLGGAIHRGEIELVFQPKVKLSDGAVLGMEALARWRHPRRGLMAAADFIAIAEQSHLISELTGQVIDKALEQAARWWADGLPIQVCVNVAARDLVGIRLADIAAAALRRHGLPPSALRLDINEQVLTGKQVQAAGTVRGLVDLGIEVSLDDFGTGYSSLPQLTRLGITEVKLDPTLVRGLSDRPDQNMTVQSMIRLAESLGIRSVAEGVETDADASALRLMGCNGAQGWYFGRPVTAEHATTWLAENYRPGPPGGDAGDVAGGIVTASGIVTAGGIAAAADGSSAVDVAAGSAPAGSAPPVPASGRAAGAVPAGSGRLAGAAPAV